MGGTSSQGAVSSVSTRAVDGAQDARAPSGAIPLRSTMRFPGRLSHASTASRTAPVRPGAATRSSPCSLPAVTRRNRRTPRRRSSTSGAPPSSSSPSNTSTNVGAPAATASSHHEQRNGDGRALPSTNASHTGATSPSESRICVHTPVAGRASRSATRHRRQLGLGERLRRPGEVVGEAQGVPVGPHGQARKSVGVETRCDSPVPEGEGSAVPRFVRGGAHMGGEMTERVREVLDLPAEQVAERDPRLGELAIERRAVERREVGVGAGMGLDVEPAVGDLAGARRPSSPARNPGTSPAQWRRCGRSPRTRSRASRGPSGSRRRDGAHPRARRRT